MMMPTRTTTLTTTPRAMTTAGTNAISATASEALSPVDVVVGEATVELFMDSVVCVVMLS